MDSRFRLIDRVVLLFGEKLFLLAILKASFFPLS